LLNLEFAVEDVNPSEITMTLPLPTEGQSFVDNTSVNTRLLLFLIVIVKLSDILQFIVGKWIGNHVVAPHISSSRTWEGFLASAGSSMLVGAALSWSVPFNIGKLL